MTSTAVSTCAARPHRFGGTRAIEEFTADHGISVQRTPRDYPF